MAGVDVSGSDRGRARGYRWAVGAAGVAGLAHAVHLRWTCDDAFISFRYARNLVRGHGLVFNVGEAVEGYTNFLWTLLTALGLALGLDPIDWTHLLGLASWVLVAALLVGHARARGRWPVAAAAWVAFPYGRVFATSGLETASFTLLSTAAVLLALQVRDRRWAALAGGVAGLAILSRPEGGLAVAAVVGLMLLRDRRWVLPALVPVVVLVVPWVAFKLSVYGELLPNTFYAKAGAGPRWADGVGYLRLFFGANALLAVGVVAWALPGGPTQRPWARLVVGVYLGVYLLHIARAGGDFMYARFCVPLVPLACVGLERAVALGLRRDPRVALLAVAVPLGVAVAPTPAAIFGDVSPDEVGAAGVVDERSWYPPEAVALARTQGAMLAECVSKTPVRTVYYGTQAMLMYYADLPYALEPHVGLTDHEVARMPPPPGVRVGHGQKADTAYLRSREIDLALAYRLQLPLTRITHVRLPEGIEGRLLTYRRPVVAALRDCGAEVLDFEAFLDEWIAAIDTVDDDKVATAWGSFSDFYFDHNDDPEREAPFRRRLGLPPRTP